ncbi:MAG: helix-turn-helix domain-containing protein [Tannerella sp.]|jgi:excisionase family DNA binding protein|nr:helix-turn-helix domain-containing protein [Tannerella sp.]
MIKLYTKKEAAEILRISLPTLDRRVSSGRLQSTKTGRRRLFTKEDIDLLNKSGDARYYK